MVVQGAPSGVESPPTALCNDSGTRYVLWASNGVYVVDDSSGSSFSLPSRIDLSPVPAYIFGRLSAVISNGILYFAYGDPRNSSPPYAEESPQNLFLAGYNLETHQTSFEIPLAEDSEIDFSRVSLAVSPDGSIQASMLGRKPNGIDYDTQVLFREYRGEGNMRDIVEIDEFNSTYSVGSTSLTFDKFWRPIVYFDVRTFSQGADIYSAPPT